MQLAAIRTISVDTRPPLCILKGRPALHGLDDLAVRKGSIFSFLGRNGAGKATTIRLLIGLLRADGGEVRVLGEAIAGPAGRPAIRQRIGCGGAVLDVPG